MYIHILILLCVFPLIQVLGQKKFDPTQEDKILALSLKEKYHKDDEFVAISSDLTYDFDYNYSSKLVEVNYTKKEKYISISGLVNTWITEYYSDNSEVLTYELKRRDEKKMTAFAYNGSFEIDDLFSHDIAKVSSYIEFPVEGYTYTLDMKKKYKDIKYFASIYFTEFYPIDNKKIVIRVPEWLNIEFKEYNFDGYSIQKTIKQEGIHTIYTYEINSLAAIINEKQMIGPSFREPHLLVLAKSHTKDESETTLFKETKDLYAWYKSLIDQMEDNPSILKPLVDQLTQNAKSEEEKIKNIYYWVQDHIKYIAFEDGIAGYQPDESQNVYKNKYGDCKGMANLLRQLLVLAGFDAHLTWIGTNRIAYDYSTPNLSVDNHMICALNYNGKRYFLDGTEKYNAFGDYAERIQGKQVLIEDGDDFILDYIPKVNSKSNAEYFTLNCKLDDGVIKGKAQKKFNGEGKSEFLYVYNLLKSDIKENTLKEYLNKNNKNIEISELISSNLEDRDLEIQLDYHVNYHNQVTEFDGEYYIDLNCNREYANFNFKDRISDYIKRYKSNYTSRITLEIPEGYGVSYLPENISYTTDYIEVNISYKVKGNQLIYTKYFDFKSAKFPKSEFKGWISVNKNLLKNYNEQITISKL